jgi:hypothetical protein
LVQTLDVMIARLRLMLADIAAKEAHLETLGRQYREQRRKVVGYTLYSETTLETSLNLMDDVAARLRDTEQTLHHLSMIKEKAQAELESLQLTRGVEQAKAKLAELERQSSGSTAATGASSDEIESEMRRLRTLINEASERAARSIGRR